MVGMDGHDVDLDELTDEELNTVIENTKQAVISVLLYWFFYYYCVLLCLFVHVYI